MVIGILELQSRSTGRFIEPEHISKYDIPEQVDFLGVVPGQDAPLLEVVPEIRWVGEGFCWDGFKETHGTPRLNGLRISLGRQMNPVEFPGGNPNQQGER